MIGLIPRGYEGYDVDDCPDCDGSGSFVWRDEREGGTDDYGAEPCATCDGEGMVAV